MPVRAVACRERCRRRPSTLADRSPLTAAAAARPTPRRPVHLKSLTVKGFKSFASATTLRLEPGITCVVGPNGSGKSNVVDAIAWVLGEQGAKALRGGKMEDVIFAGTAGRAPLGRAEVTLTIDNTDGALPIEYTEVSITRRMFRSGESEYEINGDCLPAARHPGAALRLRHRPGDARHRRPGPARHRPARQARGPARLHRGGGRRAQAPQAQGEGAAQARVDAGQPQPAHRPHRRAAPPAQAAGQAGRGGPAGGEHPGRPARREDPAARRRPGRRCARPSTARSPTRPRCGSGARRSRRRTSRSRSAWPSSRPRWPRTRRCWPRPRRPFLQLSTLQERLRATHQLATERLRNLTHRAEEERPGRDPDELAAEAEELREQEREMRAALAEDQARLNEAVEGRQQMERRLAEAEQALVAAVEGDRRPAGGAGQAGRPGQRHAHAVDRRRRRDRPARRRARRGAGAGRGGAGGVRAGRGRRDRGRPRHGRARRAARRGGRRGRGDRPHGSRSSATSSARSRRTRPSGRPARTRWPSACGARTAPAPCWPGPTGCRACSAASPPC